MRHRRIIAWVLLTIMVGDITWPTALFALTSGPTQPEVQSFKPVSASDMVDLFTGDFSYNIPLLDVEGYPVNLFYQGGITMDQEASWVGLGWNLNPGAVNRNLRGLPDDFNGDELRRDMHMRPNRSFGISAGVSGELAGVDELGNQIGTGVNVSGSTSMTFNNYVGVTNETSLGASLKLPVKGHSKSAFTAGLGLSSGSHSGLRLKPQIGIDAWQETDGSKLSFGIGLDIGSRRGLSEVTLDAKAKSASTRPSEVAGESYVQRASETGLSTSFNIGQPTYSPQVSMSMEDLTFSFNISNGGDFFLLNPNFRWGAFFSVQRLRDATTRTPAYGYLHLQHAQTGGAVALDFNREKGGPYTPDQASLGIAGLTPDIFSVSGQGISGSYRAFRSEVGHVFDQAVSSGGSSGSLGVELGLGNLVHAGVDVKVNSTTTWSGRWNLFNQLLGRTRFVNPNSALDEPVCFRSASEPVVVANDEHYGSFGGSDPYRPRIMRVGSFEATILPTLENSGGDTYINLPAVTRRTSREPRSQTFQFLTKKEVQEGLGLEPLVERDWLLSGSSHMSEVTILDQVGQRFIYGLPVYNIDQEDVTFSIENGNSLGDEEELIGYAPGVDDTRENRSGVDQYFSRSTTPSYAHAFLITAILSPDYSDVDEIPGPSNGDLGSYTHFRYHKNRYSSAPEGDFFPWRTPVAENMARLERGLGATDQDDRASYVYGRKELWYLDRIETQNRVAIFELNDPQGPSGLQDAQGGARLDGYGVDRNGAPRPEKYQRYLKKISLFDRRAYEEYEAAVEEAVQNSQDPNTVPRPEPIKEVHFAYDYSLCPGTPNSAGGKLTLKRVWFTYGRSLSGGLSPYVFDYGQSAGVVANPPYDLGGQDRWGRLKPDFGSALAAAIGAGDCMDVTNGLFPYAEQNEGVADLLAGAWSLKSIRLPSGGVVQVGYESDDYGFVQNQRATRMFRMAHVADPNGPATTSINPNSTVEALREKRKIYVALPSGITDEGTALDYMTAAVAGMSMIYYRTRVHYKWRSPSIPSGIDFASGYGQLEAVGVETVEGALYGTVLLEGVHIDECNACLGGTLSPMFRSAIEHARLNYPKQLYTPLGMDDELNAWDIVQWIPAQVSAIVQFITGLAAFFDGPNGEIIGLPDGRLDGTLNPMNMRMGESYIKLIEPDARKKGGGYRIRSIQVYDSWAEMESQNTSASYSQAYSYGDTKGSWGVASYEPMIGADENPFRVPIFYNVERTMSADERFYMEEPFGESFFPSPVVGYSRVEVKDVSNTMDPTQRGTGKVVHEFYTAKDFPTKTKRTTILPINHPSPGVAGLVGIRAADHMHVSQGFVVETNDMHGKPKSVSVYPEPDGESASGTQPISSVQYVYRTDASGALDNHALTIAPDGTTASAVIGRHYEFLLDFREYGSIATSAGVQANLEAFMLGILPFGFPPILPQFSTESTRFRSAVLVKVIDHSGLLQKIVKTDHGSVVSTENIAHDAITGKVLLTRSNNEYRDPVYSFEQPAYWYYDGMGPAYRNLGATARLTLNAQGVAVFPNARTVFVPGDEVSMRTVTIPPALPVWHKGWVTKVDDGSLRIVDRDGQPIVPAGDHFIKVIRSGRRNMQDVPMADVTALKDPLSTLPANSTQRVLKATAVEFKDEWRKDCACSPSAEAGEGNPYADNRKGVWRQFRERTWLTDRVRTLVNDNTDIRHDGIYASFDPFYKVHNGSWSIDQSGWTMVREITDYSARSQALEEKDALGLYSSATFSHAGLLPNTVAANARHQEVGFESFESTTNCADEHFRFDDGEGTIVDSRAHSGRHSIRVPNGQRARFVAVLRGCEEVECPMVQSYQVTAGVHQITVTGGSPPYDATGTMILSGNPAIGLLANGVSVSGTGAWSVRVVIRDATGCERSMVVPTQP